MPKLWALTMRNIIAFIYRWSRSEVGRSTISSVANALARVATRELVGYVQRRKRGPQDVREADIPDSVRRFLNR